MDSFVVEQQILFRISFLSLCDFGPLGAVPQGGDWGIEIEQQPGVRMPLRAHFLVMLHLLCSNFRLKKEDPELRKVRNYLNNPSGLSHPYQWKSPISLLGETRVIFLDFFVIYFKQTVKCQMSRVMRKPDFCICENKDAAQLRGNR